MNSFSDATYKHKIRRLRLELVMTRKKSDLGGNGRHCGPKRSKIKKTCGQSLGVNSCGQDKRLEGHTVQGCGVLHMPGCDTQFFSVLNRDWYHEIHMLECLLAVWD